MFHSYCSIQYSHLFRLLARISCNHVTYIISHVPSLHLVSEDVRCARRLLFGVCKPWRPLVAVSGPAGPVAVPLTRPPSPVYRRGVRAEHAAAGSRDGRHGGGRAGGVSGAARGSLGDRAGDPLHRQPPTGESPGSGLRTGDRVLRPLGTRAEAATEAMTSSRRTCGYCAGWVLLFGYHSAL